MKRWQCLVGCGVIGMSVCLPGVYGRGESPIDASAAGAAAEQPPVLRTQQFESGELRLPDIDSARLEAFLRDLNHRRDYDFSQHDHHPGPDHAYLTHWIHKVMDELFTRGYYVDRHGDLHQPGAIVATR